MIVKINASEFRRSSDGASLAEVIEGFDAPSENALMCASAELLACPVIGCPALVSTEEVYADHGMAFCPEHDPEDWDGILTSALGRQNYKEMGHDTWLLSPEQAQQLSGASDAVMTRRKTHPEFTPEFWLIQIDDGADFWFAITENGTGARIYDVVVRYWCEENDGTTFETLLNGDESFLTVQRVLDFCTGPACAPLEDSEASPQAGE